MSEEKKEVISLKLYKCVEIDYDKISVLKYVPSNYQWELVRQNIKFILLFIDKVQITLANLISKNSSYIQSNKYEIFMDLWKESSNKFPKYSVLFTILDNLTEIYRFNSNKSIEDEIHKYFNSIKFYFSSLYDNICEHWLNELVGEIKLNKLGNGDLFFPDPSVSNEVVDILNFIYLYFSNKIKDYKKYDVISGQIYFNNKYFNLRNFTFAGVTLMGSYLVFNNLLKKK